MTDVGVYRDDGPVAAALSRVGQEGLPAGGIFLATVMLVATFIVERAETTFVSVAAAAAFVVLVSIGQSQRPPGRATWLVPPLLRAAEYGGIVLLASSARGSAPAAAFALLGAAAFHQYDVDHRLRTRGVPPPRTVGYIGLGWDGRLLVMVVAAVLGVFPQVAFVVATVLAIAAGAENLLVWRHRPHAAAGEGAPPLDAGGK